MCNCMAFNNYLIATVNFLQCTQKAFTQTQCQRIQKAIWAARLVAPHLLGSYVTNV